MHFTKNRWKEINNKTVIIDTNTFIDLLTFSIKEINLFSFNNLIHEKKKKDLAIGNLLSPILADIIRTIIQRNC